MVWIRCQLGVIVDSCCYCLGQVYRKQVCVCIVISLSLSLSHSLSRHKNNANNFVESKIKRIQVN